MALPTDFEGGRWQRPLYVALVVVAIALVWRWPRVPTQDGPSHAYGLLVTADLLAGTGPWSQVFVLAPDASPNWGYLAVGLPMAAVLGPLEGALASERAVVTAFLLAVALGVPSFLRAFGRSALPLSFLALPLAWSYPLFLGFHAYVLSAGLLFPALALLWRGRRASLVRRSSLTTALSVGLAFLHLIPGALLVVASALLEATRDRKERRLLSVAAVAAPAAALALAFVLTHQGAATAGLGLRHPPAVLLWILSHFGTAVLDARQMLAAYALLLFLLAAMPWRSLGRDHARRFLSATAGAVLLAYLALPNFLASGAYLNERLPWLVPLLCLPLLRPVPWLPGRRGAVAQSVFVALLATAWLAATLAFAGRLARSAHTVVTVPQGATVAVARFGPRPLWPLYDPWLHLGSLVATRSRAVPLAFADFYLAYHPVRWRPTDWPGPTDAHDLYYRPRETYPSAWRHADFVVALDADAADRAWLSARCTPYAPGDAHRAAVSVWRDCTAATR